MHKTLLFLLLLLISTFCAAQDRGFIFGQLVDTVENEPIPFASIVLKVQGLGVISNIDGTFKVPLQSKELGEILEISCMGYETKEVLFNGLIEEQSNIIILKPSVFTLKEAVVSANIKKLSAQQIVKIAVISIPQNYSQNKFGLVGYYRDYQVKNEKYTNLNEAIIEVVDEGFGTEHNFDNRYKLYSYNKNSDFEIDSFAKQPYDYKDFNKIIPKATLKNKGGNEFIILIVHDAIRNYKKETFSFINNISSDFLENHRFRLKDKTSYKDQTVFEIDCTYRNDDYLAQGKIFVNTKDFAIHKLDYAVYLRKKPNIRSAAVNAQERFSDGFRQMNRELLYHIQMEYARGSNEKLFLHYISFYNKVLIHRPAEFASKFIVALEDKTFRIRLNKLPAELEKIKNNDFRVSYKNEHIPIKEFYFLEDERMFVVCPHLKYEKAKDAFDYLFNKTDNLEVSDLKYEYGTIQDSLGNNLDDRKWEYIHQYREFFTQKILTKGLEDTDKDRLMIQTLPLDSEEQPVNYDGINNMYWKNTPLPYFEN